MFFVSIQFSQKTLFVSSYSSGIHMYWGIISKRHYNKNRWFDVRNDMRFFYSSI